MPGEGNAHPESRTITSEPSPNATFGSPLYELLHDDFFLDTMIGSFAAQTVHSALKSGESLTLEDLRKVIGDPLVRYALAPRR